jgi:hypothetical protein
MFGKSSCGVTNAFGYIPRKKWGWSFLDQLLVAPLNGAVASSKIDYVPVGIAEYLDFYVTCVLY